MPDKVNILISYLGVCTYQQTINVETFGFALYNWKTDKFSQPPFDVVPPKVTGTGIPAGWNFSSPVIANNQVTFIRGAVPFTRRRWRRTSRRSSVELIIDRRQSQDFRSRIRFMSHSRRRPSPISRCTS